jgi:hypothetical protein
MNNLNQGSVRSQTIAILACLATAGVLSINLFAYYVSSVSDLVLASK